MGITPDPSRYGMTSDDLKRIEAGDYEHAREMVMNLTERMPDGHIIKVRCEHLIAQWDSGEMPPEDAMRNVGAVVGEFVSAEEVRRARRRISWG